MALKITCPHCQHAATLKAWKAGTFKPQCSQCKQSFLLKISADDPPQLDVRVISDAPAQAQPAPKAAVIAKPKPAAVELTKGPAEVEQTIVQTAVAPSLSKPVAASPIVAKPSGTPRVAPKQVGPTDVTVAPEHTRVANPEATMDSVAAPEHASKAPASQLVRAKSGASTSKRSAADTREPRTDLPDRIGGYKIVDELGRGGMGAVYLARQLSLDRPVALKTIQTQWADDPRVIARFIREAYAAGQLIHNNVVQIYDLGQDGDTNFFSMELVPGGSLSDLLKKHGRLEPAAASAMILQAARGLKYAHDHGMVHRDIKPANLMISSDGLVKVADLGLVKTPAMDEDSDTAFDRSAMLASANASVTGVGSTMGTPAYMSPEQADDATSVDHRADIYSLGCTFYALLTGTPPFQGASAVEVVSKHRTEPLQRPESIVSSVPKALGDIVERMTAKSPADRFQDLSEVIAALESFLNQQQAKQPLLTDPKLVAALEAACTAFNRDGLATAKKFLPLSFVATCLLLSIITGIFHWQLGIAIGMSGLAAIVSHLGMAMFSAHQEPIAKRLRSVIWLSPWTDWLTWIIGVGVILLTIWVSGLWVYAVGAAALGMVFAYLYETLVNKTARSRRTASIESGEQIIKRLRLSGIDEREIQGFVARFAGRQWEEFFCELFDYEAMRSIRTQLTARVSLSAKRAFDLGVMASLTVWMPCWANDAARKIKGCLPELNKPV